MLLVVLDFEGLGSFERSEQEDIFLSVLNASVSLFTVFRMESRFDKDIDGLFSRFQKGVQLIKNDTRLFRGLLYMSVKDVNMNDQQGVIDELVTKLDGIFEANRDQNFLTEMYSGKLEVNCSPPFGTVEYYQSMENDAAKTLRDIIAPSEDVVAGFSTGKAFLDCLRIVLAKISILDWTSMDKSTHNLLIADVEQRLPGILRTGCQVPRPLLAEAIIPSHLKEDVLEFGSREKLVITLKEVCQEYPYFAPKWTTLNEQVNLDNVRDDAFDVGFDVTDPQNKKFGTIQKTLVVQFQQFLALQNKVYGNSKLTADDHKSYDDYLTFVVCRRKTLSRFGCRAANTNALPVISDVCTQLRMRQILATTVLRIMLAVVSVNTLNVAMKITRLEFHRVLEVQAMKGNANARKGNTPVDNRVLLLAPNCDHNCSLLADHFGDHRCSVLMHVCGVACSASTCVATCLLDIQREHTVHKCAEMQCLQPCLMNGCKSNCGVKNHFHGQMIESCAFAKENGLHEAFDEDVDMPDNDSMTTVTHMCLGSHACAEVCSIDGICEQKVHLKKSSRTYNGARGTFEYVFQEMNGCKKQCAQILPCGSQDHGDLEHSCAPQGRENGTEDEEQRQEAIHYCAVRCPSCDYYCNKEFGHMGLHTTSHGNMRQTYFMAKSNDIDIEDRKYRVGERGTAEMCNLFCTKIGRGHTHYLPCDSRNGKNCTAVASKDRRRHCVDELYPPPDKGMDELLHVQFWATIGWEDPCTEEERALFAKCPFKCNAPEHEDEGKVPSHCVLDAWHQPELKPEMSGDGFAYVDGHKFECVHAVDTGKFHNIFVLDSSGSMSGQPWQNLLCACNEFVLNRHQDGGANDLVSYITFDHRSYIRCEAQPLGDTLQMVLPYSGGGTRFTEGLRAANEVLSRNKFEEFQVVLIFFSDGRPCDIELAMTIAKHTRLSYAKYDVKSFVVGFGRMDLAVLKRVAVEMGGEYRQVLDTDALKTELQRISAILCNSEASLALANPTTGPGYLERGQSKRARI
ncbi:hypothetical protein PHYBOEH_000717 [Phytophthora boehmeriae]|uniref:VWFA domain-containing protein n=1 Tax=Phytophthora boehmeriae TaxID=109152 RepID=A0A8T1WYW9_9STRA|nr:hypothetical protein PHYBOEH_000717 [Phytophthora boehmeriae]